MAPITAQEQKLTSTNMQSPELQPVAQAPSDIRTQVSKLQADASVSDRKASEEVSADRQALVDKVLQRFGSKVFSELATHHPGRSAQWLADRVVDQAAVNAENAFKPLNQVTDSEIAKAISVTLSRIDNPVITPREGPKANNAGLLKTKSYEVADAILDSVTHYSAKQTLLSYRNAVGDETFVTVVTPGLTRNGVFAWTGSDFKHNGEKLQHELVHKLLMEQKIPQEYRYQSTDPKDLNAIGIEYQQQKEERNRLAAERRVAEEQEKELKNQQRLDGFISGARSEQERAQIMRNWKSAAESPATDQVHAQRLKDALDRARANDPKPAPISTYIDSTNKRYSAADIHAAQQFAPTVAAAMKAKDPVAFEQSRPVTAEEIAQLRERVSVTRESVTNGLSRSEELSKKIGVLTALGSSGELGQLIGEDSQKLQGYRRSCQALQSSLQKMDALCNQLEKASVSSPQYQQLLTEFKAAQHDILQAGGLNDYRAKIGGELIAVERRYRLGNEDARNLAALDKLSPEEKRKSLLTLEGTLSAQLAAGKDISHTLKAIHQLDNDPKRLASYLYRLERAGKNELVSSFAQALADNGALKSSLEGVLEQSLSSLKPEQRQTVERIQNVLAGVDTTVNNRTVAATEDQGSLTIAA
jgi:hypothetical protein